MPRLPDVDALGARPVPQARRNPARETVRNAGAIGDAVAGVGAVVGQAGEMLHRAREEEMQRRDQLERQAAASSFLQEKIRLDAEFAADPDIDSKEARYSEAITKAQQDAAAKIGSTRSRELFNLEAKPDLERGLANVRLDVFKGHRDRAMAAGYESIEANKEAALAATDPKDGEKALQLINGTLATLRQAGYISATEEAEKRHKIARDYGEGRLELMPDEEQIAMLSQSLSTGKAGNFTDFIPRDRRAELLRQAGARKAASDRAARAEQRLAMAEMVDRAEGVARLQDDGVPLTPETVDQAIIAAETAGQDALVYRLKVGKVKTLVSLEMKDASPVELQNTINGLEAKIAKAGNNAKPEDIIARDHLMTLLEKTSRAVRNDPLSWVASARGQAVPQLDWDDRSSIMRRLEAARVASKETGAPLSPLTDEELAVLKTDMDQGAGGQVRVLQLIRRLGTQGAVAVARQLAPENHAFRVAVGIATTSSLQWSTEIAKDALMGGDAIKANPSLFNDKLAKRQFAEEAVPALRLLSPELRLGVFEAARNIYGAAMSREGWTTWNQESWPSAIDRALGAYRDRNGHKRGGLGSYREMPIILPEHWRQRDFDAAIARATDASFEAAGDGAPVWANGSRVSAAQMKRLRIEAVGGGVYVFGDGNGYVVRKDGSPYRMDASKLLRNLGPPIKRLIPPPDLNKIKREARGGL